MSKGRGWVRASSIHSLIHSTNTYSVSEGTGKTAANTRPVTSQGALFEWATPTIQIITAVSTEGRQWKVSRGRLGDQDRGLIWDTGKSPCGVIHTETSRMSGTPPGEEERKTGGPHTFQTKATARSKGLR